MIKLERRALDNIITLLFDVFLSKAIQKIQHCIGKDKAISKNSIFLGNISHIIGGILIFGNL